MTLPIYKPLYFAHFLDPFCYCRFCDYLHAYSRNLYVTCVACHGLPHQTTHALHLYTICWIWVIFHPNSKVGKQIQIFSQKHRIYWLHLAELWAFSRHMHFLHRASMNSQRLFLFSEFSPQEDCIFAILDRKTNMFYRLLILNPWIILNCAWANEQNNCWEWCSYSINALDAAFQLIG